MITRVSIPVSINRYSKYSKQSTPAFGMAKLNNIGEEAADQYGFQRHKYLDPEMYARPSIFTTKSKLAERLEKHANFVELCKMYGCTRNGVANAKFIENQIFSVKSKDALADVPDEDYRNGLMHLYDSNYDNPDLSVKSSKKLLEMISEYLPTDILVKHHGILSAGTTK